MDDRVPGVRQDERRQDLEQCCLSGPVRSKEAEDLATANGQGDLAQGADRRVPAEGVERSKPKLDRMEHLPQPADHDRVIGPHG